MNREAIRQAFAGPIASIRTPFNRDGSIDYAGLRRCVDFDIQAGSKALLITWGDSLFSLLSDREIADLTRAVVECAAGRAAVAACTGHWATAQAVEFAVFCREIGADILQTFQPFWYPGAGAPEAAIEHLTAVAGVIPVMANSADLQRNSAPEGLSVAGMLLEGGVNVLAMKADVTGEYDRRMTGLVADRWTIFAGGQKSFHLELWPYGCQGYLSTFITFMPEVTHAYWRAVESGDVAAAARIIEKIDRPFFTHIIASPGGFDAALHGILELCGLAQRWRRPPFYSLSDDELEALARFLASLPQSAVIPGD